MNHWSLGHPIQPYPTKRRLWTVLSFNVGRRAMSSLWRWMRIISRCCIPVCVEHVSSRTQGTGTCKKEIQRMTLTTCSPWEVWGLTLSRICETTAKYHKKWNYQYLKYHPGATESSVKHPSFISSGSRLVKDDFNLTGLSAQARLLWSFNFLFLSVGISENGLHHVIPCYTTNWSF